MKVIASGSLNRLEHWASHRLPKDPEVPPMSPDAIDAALATCEARSRQATQAGAQAFGRLLKLAEERDSGQIQRIARFLAATYNGQAFQFDPLSCAPSTSRSATTCCAAWTTALGPRRPVHARPER